MKVVRIHPVGGPEVLEIDDLPKPVDDKVVRGSTRPASTPSTDPFHGGTDVGAPARATGLPPKSVASGEGPKAFLSLVKVDMASAMQQLKAAATHLEALIGVYATGQAVGNRASALSH